MRDYNNNHVDPEYTIDYVKGLTDRISMRLFGKKFQLRIERDNKGGERIFLQVIYTDQCRQTLKEQEWHGRKWYLSEHMTNDEVIKTAFVAFKSAVEHEVMEAFQVDGKVLFNPHLNFEELLVISDREVRR